MKLSTNDLIKTKDLTNGRWAATAILEVITMSDAARGLPLTKSHREKIFPTTHNLNTGSD